MYYPGLMILGVVRGVLPVGEPMMLISYLELKNCRNVENGSWWWTWWMLTRTVRLLR